MKIGVADDDERNTTVRDFRIDLPIGSLRRLVIKKVHRVGLVKIGKGLHEPAIGIAGGDAGFGFADLFVGFLESTVQPSEDFGLVFAVALRELPVVEQT